MIAGSLSFFLSFIFLFPFSISSILAFGFRCRPQVAHAWSLFGSLPDRFCAVSLSVCHILSYSAPLAAPLTSSSCWAELADPRSRQPPLALSRNPPVALPSAVWSTALAWPCASFIQGLPSFGILVSFARFMPARSLSRSRLPPAPETPRSARMATALLVLGSAPPPSSSSCVCSPRLSGWAPPPGVRRGFLPW